MYLEKHRECVSGRANERANERDYHPSYLAAQPFFSTVAFKTASAVGERQMFPRHSMSTEVCDDDDARISVGRDMATSQTFKVEL